MLLYIVLHTRYSLHSLFTTFVKMLVLEFIDCMGFVGEMLYSVTTSSDSVVRPCILLLTTVYDDPIRVCLRNFVFTRIIHYDCTTIKKTDVTY